MDVWLLGHRDVGHWAEEPDSLSLRLISCILTIPNHWQTPQEFHAHRRRLQSRAGRRRAALGLCHNGCHECPEQRAHLGGWDTNCTTRCHLPKGTWHFPKRYCASCACIHSYTHVWTAMCTGVKHEKPFTRSSFFLNVWLKFGSCNFILDACSRFEYALSITKGATMCCVLDFSTDSIYMALFYSQSISQKITKKNNAITDWGSQHHWASDLLPTWPAC